MATKKKAEKAARIKGSTGHSPAILGKGAAHTDRTKYTRKEKHNDRSTNED